MVSVNKPSGHFSKRLRSGENTTFDVFFESQYIEKDYQSFIGFISYGFGTNTSNDEQVTDEAYLDQICLFSWNYPVCILRKFLAKLRDSSTFFEAGSKKFAWSLRIEKWKLKFSYSYKRIRTMVSFCLYCLIIASLNFEVIFQISTNSHQAVSESEKPVIGENTI